MAAVPSPAEFALIRFGNSPPPASSLLSYKFRKVCCQKMKPRTNGRPGSPGPKSFQREGTNWIAVAGGALLSTLSIRLGYKLKQALDAKQPKNACNGNGESVDRKKSRCCQLHSNGYCFAQDDDDCFNYVSGTQGSVEMKQQAPECQLLTETALPLVTVPTREYNKENNGVLWSSSPDRLELTQKPFHHSNSSDSPSVSESGSDIYSKREVIQKLRQQLKRRDDMILEMQDRIVELQTALGSQMSHSSQLQSLLDASNRDLLESQREIQRLRKAIADHCVGQNSPKNKPLKFPAWPSEGRNGHTNGFLDVESGSLESPEKGREGEKIDMLRREVGELREIIEGKEFLLHSYKEQKTELSLKVKELQERLDLQLPNIL